MVVQVRDKDTGYSEVMAVRTDDLEADTQKVAYTIKHAIKSTRAKDKKNNTIRKRVELSVVYYWQFCCH